MLSSSSRSNAGVVWRPQAPDGFELARSLQAAHQRGADTAASANDDALPPRGILVIPVPSSMEKSFKWRAVSSGKLFGDEVACGHGHAGDGLSTLGLPQ